MSAVTVHVHTGAGETIELSGAAAVALADGTWMVASNRILLELETKGLGERVAHLPGFVTTPLGTRVSLLIAGELVS